MGSLRIAIVVGTRPQIIKSAPVIQEAIRRNLELDIIHTGQHYDYELSQIFIKEFNLPKPTVDLNVGSGSHVYQIKEIMLRLEKYLLESKPSIVMIPGDTNSALAGALTAVKLDLSVAHIEAGARCYDMHMTEEINRRLIDHCSEILFTPTENCKANLERESVLGSICQVGDTMYDVFLRFRSHADKSDIFSKLELSDKEYGLLTLHRAENVDNAERLKSIFKGVTGSSIRIVFPIHPRTKNRLGESNISLEGTNVKVVEPVGYIEMLKLLKHAKMIITDSGGLQKEAFWSKTPCITLRDRTEWVETVSAGVNFLVGTESDKIVQAINLVEKEYDVIKERFTGNPFGDGRASERIINVTLNRLEI